MSFKEIQVPVPWGFVAGKSWGDENKKIILAFHDLQGNANIFDNLIPLLPKSFHYICFDLPSHGKSSHFKTEGVPTAFDYILTIKLIMDHLKRERYILMSHSYSAFIAIMFTHIYPECVEKVITIEAVHYFPTQLLNFVDKIKWCIKLYCQLFKLKQNTAPVYKLAKGIEKSIKRRNEPTINENLPTSILDESEATLLESAGNNKYKFAAAQRLKYTLGPLILRENEVDLIKLHTVKCPYLLIMASEVKLLYDSMIEVIEVFRKTNKSFQVQRVEGSHGVHFENPEIVAKYINQFLLSNKL